MGRLRRKFGAGTSAVGSGVTAALVLAACSRAS